MSVPPTPEGNKGRNQAPLGAKGEATRQRILAVAEELFGTRGFHQTSITDITRQAGVAQGTFYLYFDSKLTIFQVVVREISHQLRRLTTEAITGIPDRRLAERRGFEAFFQFLHDRPYIYKVVREAEFVDEELFRWYYGRMAEGYRRRLAEAQAEGQIRSLDPETLAWCIMGVAHMLGLRYVLWDQGKQPILHVDEVMEFLNYGFAAGPRPEEANPSK